MVHTQRLICLLAVLSNLVGASFLRGAQEPNDHASLEKAPVFATDDLMVMEMMEATDDLMVMDAQEQRKLHAGHGGFDRSGNFLPTTSTNYYGPVNPGVGTYSYPRNIGYYNSYPYSATYNSYYSYNNNYNYGYGYNYGYSDPYAYNYYNPNPYYNYNGYSPYTGYYAPSYGYGYSQSYYSNSYYIGDDFIGI